MIRLGSETHFASIIKIETNKGQFLRTQKSAYCCYRGVFDTLDDFPTRATEESIMCLLSLTVAPKTVCGAGNSQVVLMGEKLA